MSRRRTVLFVGESGSLAHVARPLGLAASLDADLYDRWLASDACHRRLLEPYGGIRFRELPGVSPGEFVRCSDRAEFPLQPAEVREHVEAELRLYDEIQPDLVLGDMRHSVAISTAVAGIPSVALANVHWSPYRDLGFDPIAPLSSVPPGERVAPVSSRSATACVNEVRRAFDLPPVAGYLDLVTRGDYTLYAEPQGFVPTTALPGTHFFIGPVLWAPQVARPEWWERWDPSRPLVYVTLGSTGLAARLQAIVDALAMLPATVVAATAGRARVSCSSPAVHVADFLPGLELSARANLVVCNGGSGTAYQALQHGTPVLGIWSNIDQYLTMMTVERQGAGRALPAAQASDAAIAETVQRLIDDPDVVANANRLGEIFRSHPAEERFRAFVARLPGFGRS